MIDKRAILCYAVVFGYRTAIALSNPTQTTLEYPHEEDPRSPGSRPTPAGPLVAAGPQQPLGRGERAPARGDRGRRRPPS